MQDPLVIVDRHRISHHALRGLLAGGDAFLVCGGPSATPLLPDLTRRGLFTMAVNNIGAAFRPSAFVCSDPPQKFHLGIWMDPQVMKFVPIQKMSKKRGTLRRKTETGFELVDVGVKGCPNVHGYQRCQWWDYGDGFFTDEAATWGNNNAGVLQTGKPKVMCTMLIGLRLLRYLGADTVYLVGADFDMSVGYGFNQQRTRCAVETNNNQFLVVNDGLTQMVDSGVFERAGLTVWNCNPRSRLTAFPAMLPETAIAKALQGYPEEPFDLQGWYEKPAPGRRVADAGALSLPGDYCYTEDRDGVLGVSYRCPECGGLSYLSGNPQAEHHWALINDDLDNPTLDPYIIHDSCGWHGQLCEGVWTPRDRR